MGQVKGKKKINKKLSRLVSKLVEMDVSIKIGDTWQCFPYSKNNKIEMGIFLTEMDEIQNGYWQEWWEKRYNYKPLNMFMVSLLHEVGHLKTYLQMEKYNLETFNFSIDWTNDCDARSNRLSTEGKADTEEFKAVNLEYFSIPLEAIATDWAEVFYRSNKDKCEKCYRKICKILAKWYNKIGVSDN